MMSKSYRNLKYIRHILALHKIFNYLIFLIKSSRVCFTYIILDIFILKNNKKIFHILKKIVLFTVARNS